MTDKELIQAARTCQQTRGCGHCTLFNKCPGRAAYLAMITDRLEAMLAENECLREVTKMMPKWVSVDERLPESEEQVLVTFTGKIQNKEYIGGYLLAEYFPGDGWILEEYPQLENPNITYWQPLPEPPSTEWVE